MSLKFDTDNQHTLDILVDDISDDIVKTSRKILRTEDINFTGGLSQRIRQYTRGKFKFITFDSPYAEFVEDGMPPGEDIDMSKLRKWVKGKIGIKDEAALGVVTGRIAAKIIAEGIIPKRFLDKSVDYVTKKWGVKVRNSQARPTGPIKKVTRTAKTIEKVVNKINKFVKGLG